MNRAPIEPRRTASPWPGPSTRAPASVIADPFRRTRSRLLLRSFEPLGVARVLADHAHTDLLVQAERARARVRGHPCRRTSAFSEPRERATQQRLRAPPAPSRGLRGGARAPPLR